MTHIKIQTVRRMILIPDNVKAENLMVILGIDPGYAIVGYGVIEADRNRYKVLDCGVITTPAKIPIENRLVSIHKGITELIEEYSPRCMSIEELFFNSNHTTAIPCAEARGVILLAAKQRGLEIYEYTPLQVKQSVVGYGRAEKKQVISMVTTILGLSKPPKPDDAADALAIAVCHGNSSGSALSGYFNLR